MRRDTSTQKDISIHKEQDAIEVNYLLRRTKGKEAPPKLREERILNMRNLKVIHKFENKFQEERILIMINLTVVPKFENNQPQLLKSFHDFDNLLLPAPEFKRNIYPPVGYTFTE